MKNAAGEVAYNNFVFNGWAKYANHKKDAAVVAKANRRLKRRMILPEHKGRRVVLEGGSIDVNGKGTLLTTEECLLSKTQERNPGFAREDYEAMFREYLGVTNVLWLGNGIAGDDTHGHVDDLDAVRECDDGGDDCGRGSRGRELCGAAGEPGSGCRSMKDQDGRPLQVETLPMPAPVYFDGQRLPASYANFYIANKLVLGADV